MSKIPDSHKDLFEKRAFAHFATVMPDGSPQVTPVWVDYDGENILINTAEGRQKTRNIGRDARVAVEITDPDNPYRYLLVRGPVVEVTDEGGDAHIDKMAKKYKGTDTYTDRRPGEVRVIIKIKPEAVTARG